MNKYKYLVAVLVFAGLGFAIMRNIKYVKEMFDTIQDVELVNNYYSCKNYCGPKAECAITREQCVKDHDCYGCLPRNSKVEPFQTNDIKHDTKPKPKDKCEIQNDVGAGKLTFSQTPQYSSLTTDIGAFARIINHDAKVPRGYQGVDMWTKSFNYGLKLANSKMQKLTPFEELIQPDYPVEISATGDYYELGPTPSNATI
jgi:hypothetical protein